VVWAREAFARPVIYVPGNHEYYRGHFKRTLAKMKAQADGTHIRLLDGEECVIGGVRFLAATLWTDFGATGNPVLAQWEAEQHMTDYHLIRTHHYRRLRPADTLADHFRARAFLRDKLAEPFSGPTVVVTHHAPSMASIAPAFRDLPGHLNASYVSDLEELLGPPAGLWIHGHTHASLDYESNGTRVVCNPRGYVPFEVNPDFDPGLQVEI
jgi:predicted phosphodiesterase